jgi:hypothetical protein
LSQLACQTAPARIVKETGYFNVSPGFILAQFFPRAQKYAITFLQD